ncbi:hypothetical protein C364_04461 [Cryptococcus neoformans Bt63]|nr:hypothetical protein C364_04461 [Cryptococcus neoformans var. grubii Bt63]
MPPQPQPQRDSDGFVMPAPPPKRTQLRAANSLPTTADIYAAKHGIPLDVQMALQNVGRRGRESVARGHRSFDRTQSVPNLVIGNSAAPPMSSFTSTHDAMQHARGVINKELMRARELQPFGSTSSTSSDVDALALEGAEEHKRTRRLLFGPDGEVAEVFEQGNVKGKVDFGKGTKTEDATLVPSRKRRSSPAEPEGSDTETDDIDDDEDGQAERQPSITFNTVESVFPPVFTSPAITHPELFGPLPGSSSTADNHDDAVKTTAARQFKGLPAGKRKLGWQKSASAPVIGLQRWGDMDVDGEEETRFEARNESLEDGFEFNNWEEVEF